MSAPPWREASEASLQGDSALAADLTQALKTDMGAGYGGASGRYDSLREVAFDYAFLLGQAQA